MASAPAPIRRDRFHSSTRPGAAMAPGRSFSRSAERIRTPCFGSGTASPLPSRARGHAGTRARALCSRCPFDARPARMISLSVRPLPLLLSCAVAFAASAGETAEAPVAFSHGDWELVCDNTGTCRAAGYQQDGESLPVSVLLTPTRWSTRSTRALICPRFANGHESLLHEMLPRGMVHDAADLAGTRAFQVTMSFRGMWGRWSSAGRGSADSRPSSPSCPCGSS